jgi:ribosomal-protein-alanine N-acetyltransferase
VDVPTLKTQRLLLRPFSDDDIEPMVRGIFGNPNVMAMLPHDPQTDDERRVYAREYIDLYMAQWSDEDFGGWAVCSNSEAIAPLGELLGFCGFEPKHIDGYRLELGYGYKQESWGKGVGLEAAIASRERFLSQERWNRFYASFVPGNTGSERIIQKIAMKYLGERDLWGSVEKGIGLRPVYTFEKPPA